MAHLHLALQRHFTKRTAEGTVEEQRIVAESVLSARFFEERAFYFAAENVEQYACLGQRDDANEPRGSISNAAHPIEQQAIVRFIGRVRAGEARGIDSWCTAKGVDFQARIVNEQRSITVPRIVERFLNCVLLEREARFFTRRDRF